LRNILFRGKREDNGEWIEGVAFPGEDWSITICKQNHIDGSLDWYEVDPASVGRYTGLKDLHGTKIFAGDIVKTKYGRLCEVRWISSPCSQCWDLIPIEATQKATDSYDVWASKNLEVVGNVHDGGAYD